MLQIFGTPLTSSSRHKKDSPEGGASCIDFIVSFVRNSIRRQFYVMKFYIPLPQPALGVPRVGLDKPLRTSLVENESLFPFQVPWSQRCCSHSSINLIYGLLFSAVFQIVHTALVCEKSTLQIVLMALVCDFSTIQIVLMALKLISHNPNSTHGSGF